MSNRFNYKQMQEFWKKIYDKMERKLATDEEGLSLVCYRNRCLTENKFFAWSQTRIFQKLLSIGFKEKNLEGKKVLDIGTGTGRWAVKLAKKGAQVIGIDLDAQIIERNNQQFSLFSNLKFLPMLATNLNFPDQTFDLVISITCLHHIPYRKQKQAIKEMCRVTKLGGWVLIIESINKKHFHPCVFPNSIKEWIDLFTEEGLVLIKNLGQEYAFFFQSGFPLKKNRKNRAKHKNENTFFHFARKIRVYLSYPLEILCEFLLPKRWARQQGFLFRKLKKNY